MNPLQHWLVHGREEGRIASPFRDFIPAAKMLGQLPRDAEGQLIGLLGDLKQRFANGELGKMVAHAAQLEPLVEHTWTELTNIKVPPFHSDNMLNRAVALYNLQAQSGFRRARYVILTNRPRWGGGRRMEGHIAHALADLVGVEDVVFLTTEESGPLPADKIPDGVRYIPFSDLTHGQTDDSRQRILAEYLRSLRPDAVFNINSKLMWDAIEPYGKALAASMRLVVGLFCDERTEHGYRTGYPSRRFYRVADQLHAVCPDSEALANDLSEQFMLPEQFRSRMRVLKAPVDTGIPVAAPPADHGGRLRQVFWAGRFDPQKRIDLVYAIARDMPDTMFRMWGEPVMAGHQPVPTKPENVIHEGKYAAFGDLPLDEADAWLYTSEWDGVPSMLLEVAMTGVPLVGSRVGGTGEILKEGYCAAIDDSEDAAKYSDGLRWIFDNVDEARARALSLREALAAERTSDAYSADIQSLLGDLPQREMPVLPAPVVSPPIARTLHAPDLSLILTVHDETVVSGPTMRSADIAIEAANRLGFVTEQIIALDNAKPGTKDYFNQPAFSHWRKVELEEGDLGRARNAVLSQAEGNNIAFLDADDLFSKNWLSHGLMKLAQARRGRRRFVVHPEINWQFDFGASIFYNTAQDHPFFSPWCLATIHLYDSLCLAPREAHEEHPYVSRDIPNGLSFQDWQFTVETMNDGWTHVVVPDTIIFKRRRKNSLVTESTGRKSLLRALDCMAIDRISDLGLPRQPDEHEGKS